MRPRLVLLCLLIGSGLRLIWPSDMEWKGDEMWMFEHARAAVAAGVWPLVGMPSAIGVVNPGLSLWPFLLISHVATTPVGMVVAVQAVNVLALWGLYAFILVAIPVRDRELWLWGLILICVSPLPILYSRKIWAQDLLPPFSLLVLVGHWYRARVWGSFLWGLVGGAIGQLHMSGFFLAGALVGWTAVRDRRSLRWTPWLIGTAIAAVGLLPWLPELLQQETKDGRLSEVLTFRYFGQWFATALGVNLHRQFGSDVVVFLREPVVVGVPTYAVALAHAFLLSVGLSIVTRWLRRPSRLADRARMAESPETRFYFQVTLLGVGILMTLSGVHVSAHYLIVVFPFIHVWLAMKLHGRPRLLTAVTLAQLLISGAFLNYVHRHGGVPEGEYGMTYQRQVDTSTTR